MCLLDASFRSECFNCSWFIFCPVKGKVVFFILYLRILKSLLTFRFFISCENLLNISAMFVDVLLDIKGCVRYIFASLFSSLKESTYKTWKTVFYVTSNAFFVLEKIKFCYFRYSNFLTSPNA